MPPIGVSRRLRGEVPKAYTLHMEVDDADSKEERNDDDEEFEELGGGAATADLKEEMQVDYDEDSQEEFVGIRDVEALDDALDDLEGGAANALDDHEGSLESMVPPESMVLAKRRRCDRGGVRGVSGVTPPPPLLDLAL